MPSKKCLHTVCLIGQWINVVIFSPDCATNIGKHCRVYHWIVETNLSYGTCNTDPFISIKRYRTVVQSVSIDVETEIWPCHLDSKRKLLVVPFSNLPMPTCLSIYSLDRWKKSIKTLCQIIVYDRQLMLRKYTVLRN